MDRDGTAPTGQMIEMTVTPDLPVFDRNPDEPAFAPASEAGMGSGAGEGSRWPRPDVDDRSGRTIGPASWQRQCENDAADEKVKYPRTGPRTGRIRAAEPGFDQLGPC